MCGDRGKKMTWNHRNTTMAAWSISSRALFHRRYFFICFLAHRLLYNTLQPSWSNCSAVFYRCCVGVKSFFKSEKQRNETGRVREEVVHFTATSLSMCKNNLYSINAFLFSLRLNLENWSYISVALIVWLKIIRSQMKQKGDGEEAPTAQVYSLH